MSDLKETIMYNNSEITVITNDKGVKLVAMKPICEAIGLNWSSQLRRIQNNEVFKVAITTMKVKTGKDDKKYNMVCLPLDKLDLFEQTICKNKLKVNNKHGYLYAMRFSNSTVKVGKSSNAKKRITQHTSSARCFGLSVLDTHIITCDDIDNKEIELITKAKQYCDYVESNEWLINADFNAIKTILNDLS